MAQLYASIAVGTAATLLATFLFLVRAEIQGRRPVMALTQRWIATSAWTSGLVVAALAAVAVLCFASLTENQLEPSQAQSEQSAAVGTDDNSGGDQALQDLKTYADNIDGKPAGAASATANSSALPDVETMIAKLVDRLEKQPDDAKGWKMLGWSYLNTGRPADAVSAYEHALKLQPDDADAKKALDAARSSSANAELKQASAAVQPSENTKPTADGTQAQTNAMVRGMVESLAARLDASPNDEAGWVLLMRSRMTLGEQEAAKTALTKALATFSNDDAATTRLHAAARELGVKSE